MKLGDGRFPISRGGRTRYLPYLSNHDPGVRNKGIRRIVIVIHGDDSDTAEDCLRSVEDAAEKAGPMVWSESLIIAPQFLYGESSNSNLTELADQGLLVFDRNRFFGALSLEHTLPRIGSFAALDEMLTQTVAPGLFPRTERIVVLGRAGGGQFVNRYAASSPYEFGAGRDRPLPMRYIVMDAGVYLYFSGNRRIPGSSPPGYQFAPPNDRAIQGAIDSCTLPVPPPLDTEVKVRTLYNRYGCGLEGLYQYHQSRRVGPDEMRRQYSRREVVHLVSEGETDPIDTGRPDLQLQGTSEVERAHVYFAHLMDEFPGIAERQHFAVVSGGKHADRDLICSPLGRDWIFQ